MKDEQSKDLDAHTGADIKAGISPGIDIKTSITDSLKTIKSSDTLALFYTRK